MSLNSSTNNSRANLFVLRAMFVALALCYALILSSNAYSKPLQNQAQIDEFYMSRNGDPLWIDRSKLNRSGKDLVRVLKQSWMNGLNPYNYNIEQIEEILKYSGNWGKLGADQALEIEVLLTDAYINYVRDLSGMRINARDMGLNPKDWKQRITASEALSLLSNNNKKIAEFLLLREPQGLTYQMLKSELRRLVEDEKFKEEKAQPLYFSSLVKAGRGYNDIPKLRARFGLVSKRAEDRYIYDQELVNAVKKFQKEKGLKADGVIGKQTLYMLNHTYMDKIKQLIVNMERLRWIEDKKPERFIVVNIPSATLWAVDNGKVRFEMPVVVGRKKRATNSFVTQIHGVRFNPTWTVPPTIKEEDILPKLQEDPNYLADKGMELYDGYGKNAVTLDPFVVDWVNVDDKELKSLRMVQVAGKSNPLGRIRVLMPNSYNIYLHDTNHKELFNRTNRYKSSGCIRLKHPEKVALFALEKRKNWSEDKMQSILKKGETADIYTPERIAVYMLYYTVWLGENNKIIYGYDVYGHDKTLLQLLEKLDGFVIPVDNRSRLVQVMD